MSCFARWLRLLYVDFIIIFVLNSLSADTVILQPSVARFNSLSPCELDSLSPECDDESDEDREAIRGKKMRY